MSSYINELLTGQSNADQHLAASIKSIDEQLGEGYAKLHPELIAAFMKTSASYYHTTLLIDTFSDKMDELVSILAAE
jgi:hypothetical protein